MITTCAQKHECNVRYATFFLPRLLNGLTLTATLTLSEDAIIEP